MHKTTRYLKDCIGADLKEKMVFLGGPRQVGKTTLAKMFVKDASHYLSWDDLNDKKMIIGATFDLNGPLIILDEIHKYRLWRTLVKGLFDKQFPELNFLVTGSARLDHFRKGGDSLLGRYHYYRLHPFTLPELSKDCEKGLVVDLLKYGGFPEPFIKQDVRFLKRWHNERNYRIINQDVRDLSGVKEISNLEMLIEAIKPRVSSLLSINSLAEDLQVSPHTINSYLDIFDNLYISFRISPYGKDRIKAVKKIQKIYLWDWSELSSDGAKFENMVASHLLKFCHFHEDYNGDKMELRYLRDVDGREIDFVVIKNKEPIFLVECKYGEKNLNPALQYYKTRLKIPKAYQVHLGTKDEGNPEDRGRIIPFNKFCKVENIK